MKTTTKVRYFVAGLFQVFGMILNELVFGKHVESKDIEVQKARWSLAGYICVMCCGILLQIGDFPNWKEKILFIITVTVMATVVLGIKYMYNCHKLEKLFH